MPVFDAPNIFASAVAHFRSGQLQQAERTCREILMFDPKHFDALHLLGVISSQLGRPEAAVEVLAKAVTQNGRSAECQFSMAAALYALGRMSEAAAHFRSAIALKPGYFAAHVNLGNILFLDGQLAEARAQYERALALDSRSALTLMNLGNVLLQEGKPQEAAAMYRRALASQPNYVDACTNLGIALAAQGQWEEAAAQYRRAIALAPAASEAHISLGEIADIVRSYLPDAKIGFEKESGGKEASGNYMIDNTRLVSEFGVQYRPYRDRVLQIINDIRRDNRLPPIG